METKRELISLAQDLTKKVMTYQILEVSFKQYQVISSKIVRFAAHSNQICW